MTKIYWILLLSLFVLFSLKGIVDADVPVGQRDAMRVIAEQYLANRESFHVFSCYYTRHQIVADAMEEVLMGNYREKNFQFDGKWYVRNGYIRLEQTCDPLVFAEAKEMLERQQIPQNGQSSQKTSTVVPISIPCTNRLIIRNNKDGLELSYSELLTGATLLPAIEQNLDGNIRSTPFDFDLMGGSEVMNPYRVITDSLNGQFAGRYDGTQYIHGMSLEVITLFPENGRFEHKYGFDPKSGFLPRYVSIKTPNGVVLEAVIIDVKELSGGRWFPIEVVTLTKRHGWIIGGYYKVNAISVDIEIPDDVFLINIPRNATISVANADDQWAILDEVMTVGPGTLEEVRTFCIDFVRAYNEEKIPFDIVQSVFGYTMLRVFACIIGLAMIATAVYLLVKKRITRGRIT